MRRLHRTRKCVAVEYVNDKMVQKNMEETFNCQYGGIKNEKTD